MKIKVLVSAMLVAATHAAADDFFVPGDFPTIAAAGNAADVGDNIIVSPGTYGGFSVFGANVRSSTGNRDQVVVNGPAVLAFGGTLESMTLAGGVEITTGEGLVTDCVIDGESLQIFGSGADVTMIESSRFQNCDNGAIQMTDGLYAVEVTDSEFINNRNFSGSGGAIRMTAPGSLSITGCVFVDNESAVDGGAIFAAADTMDLTVLSSTFVNNRSGLGEAGAIYYANAVLGGDLLIELCSFDGNVAKIIGEASAVYVETNEVVLAEITQCSFSNNTAGSTGGAVAGFPVGSDPQFLTVADSEFCGNTPSDIRGIVNQIVNTFELECDDCIADTNGDGMLSPADFNAWILAYNTNLLACDQNGDIFCTPADFNAWILNFNAGC